MLFQEYFLSGFNVILPTLVRELNIPPAATVWPAGAIALVTCAFLLPFGRLGDMYGGYIVYVCGLAWFCIWTLITGFSTNEVMLNMCRALSGLGVAAFIPSGIMLLGSIYRPGPRKNLVFAVYGGSAPLGFFFGVLLAGVAGSFLGTGWYFQIGSILIGSTLIAAIPSVPSDFRRTASTSMDWLGAGTIISGLILLVFALTDGAHAPKGFTTPYIIATLILGIILLGAAVYVEGWVASVPLLPPAIFKAKYAKAFYLGLFFNYGCLGTFLLFSTLYMQNIMGATPIQVALWYTPMCAGGVFLAILGGYIMHMVPGTILMTIAGCGWLLTSLLFALAPLGANYWAWVFPAMLGATIGIDVIYNVANVFITSNLSSKQQGLAGGLASSVLFLGIAVLLGIADIVQTKTAHQGLKESYQNVFWFQLASCSTSLVLLGGFVRINNAGGQLTVDEQEALDKESATHAQQ